MLLFFLEAERMLETTFGETNTVSIASSILEKFYPLSQELIRRGQPIDDEIFPSFAVAVKDIDKPREKALRRRGETIGRIVSQRVILNDGTDYAVRMSLPDKTSNLIVANTTAFGTTVDGYNGQRQAEIVTQTGQSAVTIGAPHSGRSFALPNPIETLNWRKDSLARSVEMNMAVLGALADANPELPRQIYHIGDSRGAMHALMAVHYARRHGLENAAVDVVAPCAPERVAPADVARLVPWAYEEIACGSWQAVRMILRGDIQAAATTVSTNPKELLHSIIGGSVTLADGEAGDAAHELPHDLPVYLSGFKGDLTWNPLVWQRLLADHPNASVITLPGTHASVADPKVWQRQIARINRQVEVHAPSSFWRANFAKSKKTHLKQTSLFW